MARISRLTEFSILLILCLCIATAANAATIVARTGDPSGSTWVLGGDAGGDQALAVSWLQTAAFSNVSITTFGIQAITDLNPQFDLFNAASVDGSGNFTGTPFATFRVPTSETILAGWTADVTPFSGLTLPADTYFLVVSASGANGGWGSVNFPPTETTDALAALGPEYFGTFNQDLSQINWSQSLPDGLLVSYAVVSEEVPEPATFVLLGAGLMALAFFRRRT